MEHFTPLTATIGGVLIGLAATILWVADGRTAGVSTVAGAIFPIHRNDVAWRVLFLVGLPLGAFLGARLGPSLFSAIPTTDPVVDLAPIGLLVAGVLVGVGTRVGRGCTSGHGICGLARFSIRSLVAVAVFMVTAMITVFIARHVL